MSSGDSPIGTSQNENPPVSPGQGERKAASVEPEILLNAILRNALDYAVITLDRDRRVTSWNIGAELVLGWKAEEIIGHRATSSSPRRIGSLGRPEAEQQMAYAQGRAEDERWHVRKDGSHLWGSRCDDPPTIKKGGASDPTGCQRATSHAARSAGKRRSVSRSWRRIYRNSCFGRSAPGITLGQPAMGKLRRLVGCRQSRPWMAPEEHHEDDREATIEAWHRVSKPANFVEHRILRGLDGDTRWHRTRAGLCGTRTSDDVSGAHSTIFAAMRRLQDRQSGLLEELQHRTRNLLAVVAAAAHQTLNASTSMEESRTTHRTPASSQPSPGFG